MKVSAPVLILVTGVMVAAAYRAEASLILEYTFATGTASPTSSAANLDGAVNMNILQGPGLSSFGIGDQSPSYGANAPVLRLTPPTGATTAALAVSNDSYVSFSLKPTAGYLLNLITLEFDAARGGASTPRGWAVQTSVGGLGSSGPIVASSDVGSQRPTLTHYSVDLSGSQFQNLTGQTDFRLFLYTPANGSSIEFDNITLNGSLAPVPEPSTLALAACGLLGLGAVAWRRRRSL